MNTSLKISSDADIGNIGKSCLLLLQHSAVYISPQIRKMKHHVPRTEAQKCQLSSCPHVWKLHRYDSIYLKCLVSDGYHTTHKTLNSTVRLCFRHRKQSGNKKLEFSLNRNEFGEIRKSDEASEAWTMVSLTFLKHDLFLIWLGFMDFIDSFRLNPFNLPSMYKIIK